VQAALPPSGAVASPSVTPPSPPHCDVHMVAAQLMMAVWAH
jgi:hypothetical protein